MTTILHYGMGTNSLGLLVGLVERGEQPDLILSADTAGEKPKTYSSMMEVQAWLKGLGWRPIEMVYYQTKDGVRLSLEEDCLKRASLPSIAFGFKSCSQRWKVRPQDYFIRDWPVARDAWARGERVTKLIGYDADEERRAHDYDDAKFMVRYPLIEWGWTRADCIAAIRRAGIAKGMQKIEQGRLNQDALVVLLHDATKISRRDIEKVLRALRSLESLYCKPVPKKVQ